jgi:hypothetical protein
MMGMATALAQMEAPEQARARWARRVAMLLVLGWMVAAPFVQLREVDPIVRAEWTDLYPQWLGAQAVLRGTNPYTTAMTQEIQRGFYGHVLKPDEQWDQQPFVYPAHVAFLIAPLTMLPWWLTRRVTTLLAPVMVVLTAWMWMRICGVKLDRVRTGILLFLILTSWPSIWAIRQLQPTILVAGLIAGSVLLFARRRDGWAGMLLALATVKPNLAALLCVWLVIQAVAQRRWRFLTVFLSSTLVLLLGAEAVLPGWIPSWIRASIACSHQPHKTSQVVMIFGHEMGIAVTLLLLAALCFRLWKIGSAASETAEFSQPVSLILAATVCLMPPNNGWMLYNDLLLIPGILVLLPARPTRPLEQVLRGLTVLSIVSMVAIAPITAAISLFVGYVPFLAILPFLNVLLPVAVLAMLLFPAEAADAAGWNWLAAAW